MDALLIVAHNNGAFRLRIVQSMSLLTPVLGSFSAPHIGAVLARIAFDRDHQFSDTWFLLGDTLVMVINFEVFYSFIHLLTSIFFPILYDALC